VFALSLQDTEGCVRQSGTENDVKAEVQRRDMSSDGALKCEKDEANRGKEDERAGSPPNEKFVTQQKLV